MNEALEKKNTYANGAGLMGWLPLGRTSPTQQRGRDRGESAAGFERQGVPGYGFRQQYWYVSMCPRCAAQQMVGCVSPRGMMDG